MAMREVELDESEQGGSDKKFFKFAAIGDSIAGVYIKRETVNGKFGPKVEYTFRNKEGDHVVSPPTDLGKKLEKASLKPGFKVIATYTADRDIGKESPMKLFKVLVDDEVKGIPKPKADLDDIAF